MQDAPMPNERSLALLLPSLDFLRFARLFGAGNVFGGASDLWGASGFGSASGLRAGPVQVAQEQATEYAENRSERKSDS
jgi:hypothetical protein